MALQMQSCSAVDVPTHRLVADEEFLPLASNTFDLATSCLSLHWVNDLPAALKEVDLTQLSLPLLLSHSTSDQQNTQI